MTRPAAPGLGRSVALAFALVVAMAATPGPRAQAQVPDDRAPGGPLVALELRLQSRLAEVRDRPDTLPVPFETDGCSGGLSQIWQIVARSLPNFAADHGDVPPWQACCVAHDRLYHRGGPDSSPAAAFAARERADAALAKCVRATGSHRQETLGRLHGLAPDEVIAIYRRIGDAMYRAVRLGGMPCTGMPWRWGYGWPPC